MRVEYIINKLIKDISLAQIMLENERLSNKKHRK